MGEAVLVVEHEEPTRAFLAQQLSDDGFEVFAVDRATSALELVEAERPDLVLLDAILPDASGFELCRRLRAGEPGRAWNRDVPVIMVSTRGDPVDRVRGFARGADDYVVRVPGTTFSGPGSGTRSKGPPSPTSTSGGSRSVSVTVGGLSGAIVSKKRRASSVSASGRSSMSSHSRAGSSGCGRSRNPEKSMSVVARTAAIPSGSVTRPATAARSRALEKDEERQARLRQRSWISAESEQNGDG